MKILRVICIFVILSCAGQSAKNLQPALTVHYYRYDGNYSGWNVWAWPLEPQGEAGVFQFDLENPDEDGFVTAHVFFSEENLKIVKEIGVIIRKSEKDNEWAGKDGQNDRFTGNKEIWLVQNDPAVYTEKPVIAEPPILFAAADSSDTVIISLLKEPADYGDFSVYLEGRKIPGISRKLEETVKTAGNSGAAKGAGGGDDAGDAGAVNDVKGAAEAEGADDTGSRVEENGGPFKVRISLSEKISDPSKLYTVVDESGAFSAQKVTMRGILDGFYYGGDDLGVNYSAKESVFKVWAPTAQAVFVALYDDPGQYNTAGKVTSHETDQMQPMDRDTKTGVWTGIVKGDLQGKYYLYRVQFADGTKTWAADPYARSVSANGQRMAVVDLSGTNPTNWQPLVSPAGKPGLSSGQKPPFRAGAWQDAVIYELHVRDFSIDENSGMKNKGKFLAFTERSTVNAAGVSTGVDHLVKLGITHVHLLPAFDFASVNELAVVDPSSKEAKHNWGYDPMHYNVPEGSYSSDPENPAARIREFKEMVLSLHNAGIRVIMDVVYNHTFQTGTWPFDALVPGYYYRTTDLGEYANGSGCGNEVASERPMVRKFIVDSCRYWAQEYHIDGFRFDLMGLIDIPTMKAVVSSLHSLDPSIIIYGEPWQAGGSILSEDMQTVIGSQKGLDFAVFNDRIRGAIKGGSDDPSRGFASGRDSTEEGIVLGLMGSVNDFTSQANESVNYVTAHDNLNLWDKFALSHGVKDLSVSPYSTLKNTKDIFENDIVKSTLLANGIVFTSQGIPFFQAGDEFLRSKFGDHNSFSSGDEINKIRWENAGLYSGIVEYYAGLIRLRREHPAFRQSSKADIERSLEMLSSEDLGVSFILKNNAANDSWRTIFVAYNGSAQDKTFTLPDPAAVWHQVVDSRRAGTETLSEHSGVVVLPGLSMAVMYSEQ